MALRMTRPTKRKESSFLHYRKRVPSDVLAKARGEPLTITFPAALGHAAVTARVRISDTVKVSLRTREPSLAKARTGLAEDQLQRAWDAIRQGPKPLTHKQVVALAGKLYRAFDEACENDPGGAGLWQKILDDNGAARSGEWASLSLRIAPLSDARARMRASLEVRFGGFVNHLLAQEALVVDEDSREALLKEAARALDDVAKKLKRNAEGDYTPDPAAARFPDWKQQGSKSVAGELTLTALHDGWKKEAERRGLSRSTFRDYESRWRMFKEWLGHDDALRVTPDNVVRYKAYRLEIGRDIQTVNASDLSTLKAIFGWAVDERLLEANPASGIRVKGKRKRRERERYFTVEEAKAVLSHAANHEPTKRELPTMTAAKRWLPWLCAYSGARVGEVAQLRKKDIIQETVEGQRVWFLRITPEADTVKTGDYRDVPIHEHLIERGFLRYVSGMRDGFLFFEARSADDVPDAKKSVCNRLRDFVRAVLTDSRVKPNHGWRHTFKTRALEAELPDRTADALCGHSPGRVSEDYRGVTAQARVNFMKRFPRYEI